MKSLGSDRGMRGCSAAPTRIADTGDLQLALSYTGLPHTRQRIRGKGARSEVTARALRYVGSLGEGTSYARRSKVNGPTALRFRSLWPVRN
jgi:hypothetical protein